MISNENFRALMDAALKRQKLKKAERNAAIEQALSLPAECRDDLLDNAEAAAREVESIRANAVPSEAAEQTEFVRWLRQDIGIEPVMIRNDGSRLPSERAQQLVLGVCVGAADLYLPELHCWVEMKRQRGGVLSDKQEAFRDRVLKIGDSWILANGADDGKKKLANVLQTHGFSVK